MSLFSELKRRNVLRVAAAYLAGAWLLVEVSDTLFSIYGLPGSAARIVATLLAIGFPITLVLAWVYELTPEGLKLEKDIDRTGPAPRADTRRLDRAIIVLLVLALGYFAVDKFVLEPGRVAEIVDETAQQARSEALVESYGDKSIAVLSFDDMSPEGDQEYLSDGIAEELLNLLAKIPELRVISRSSAFSFKGQNLEIPEIAERLNVAHILEGSVRKDGNRVRITAQLIEARSDTHLWSETYDRTLDDVFAIQDEVAATVVDQLKVKLLTGIPHVEETDPEAYVLYLRAENLGKHLTEAALEQSNAMLKQVLTIAPDYARAWRLLARNYAVQAGKRVLPREEGLALARAAIDRALAIDPELAEAHSWLGMFEAGTGVDLNLAARSLQLALRLEPRNFNVLSHAANFLAMLDREEVAIAVQEYLLTLDPLNPILHSNLAWNYLAVGRFDDAIATARTLLILSPDFEGIHGALTWAFLLKGEYNAALGAIQEESSEASRLYGLVTIYHATGRVVEADAALNELTEKYGQDLPYWISSLRAYRGEIDRSFDWLENAVAYKNPPDWITTKMWFANLYDDPRWLLFLERIGRSPAQLDAIEFEVTLPQ